MDVTVQPPFVEQSTNHRPSKELLTALQANGWWVSGIDGPKALLTHPEFGTLHVELDPAGQDRVIPLIDGRQVPYRMAVAHARGEQ
jgi:hypothetical protein